MNPYFVTIFRRGLSCTCSCLYGHVHPTTEFKSLVANAVADSRGLCIKWGSPYIRVYHSEEGKKKLRIE
jgi:hypothetical protein